MVPELGAIGSAWPCVSVWAWQAASENNATATAKIGKNLKREDIGRSPIFDDGLCRPDVATSILDIKHTVGYLDMGGRALRPSA
jgi:hypothetical protein